MTTDPTARPASTPAPVAVPEAIVRLVRQWDEEATSYDLDGQPSIAEALRLAARELATAIRVHAPRPEPVVDPLPSEALRRLAERGVGTDLTPTVSATVDVGWWYEYLRSLDRRWREEVARIADRLVPEDDEDTVRVPRDSLTAMLHAQREWSTETFGPGSRLAGVLAHIRSELDEVEAAPEDVEEWIDVVILALDGAWRAGHEPEVIVDALLAKYAKNRARSWPDWRTADPDAPIEHVR